MTSLGLVTNYFTSSYNSLQTTLAHRFQHGLDLVVNHTWSKALDDGSLRYIAFATPSLIKGNTASDTRQRVSMTVVYRLPFGAGSRSLIATVVRGWNLNLIGVVQSGSPLTVTSGANVNGATGPNYPNVVGNANGPGTYAQWFRYGGVCESAEQYVGQRWTGDRLRARQVELRHQLAARIPAARASDAAIPLEFIRRDQHADASQSEHKRRLYDLRQNHVNFRQSTAATRAQNHLLTAECAFGSSCVTLISRDAFLRRRAFRPQPKKRSITNSASTRAPIRPVSVPGDPVIVFTRR